MARMHVRLGHITGKNISLYMFCSWHKDLSKDCVEAKWNQQSSVFLAVLRFMLIMFYRQVLCVFKGDSYLQAATKSINLPR